MEGLVQSRGLNSNRGLSPELWRDFVNDTHGVTRDHLFFFDDFQGHKGVATASATAFDGIFPIYSAGCTITFPSDPIGVMKLNQDGTDNDAVVVAPGAANATLNPCVYLAETGYLDRLTIWEMRVKVSQIAAASGFFAGLYDVGATLATTLPIADAGTLTAGKLVGFWQDESDTDAVDSVYGTAANVTHKADAGVIAADTYIKLGGRFKDKYYTAYINGVQVGDPVLYSATNFPDNLLLGLCVCHKLGSATASSMSIDWWGLAQVRD